MATPGQIPSFLTKEDVVRPDLLATTPDPKTDVTAAEWNALTAEITRNATLAVQRQLKTTSFGWVPGQEDGILFVDTTVAPVTISLPAVAKVGVTIKKVNTGTNKITIARLGSEKIEGQNIDSLDLPGSDAADRSAWRVEGQTGAAADAGWWITQLPAAGYVPTSRTITAGAGLTGGGDLTANRTLAVDFGEAGDIQPVGTAAAAGSSGEVADAAHVHAHGNQTVETLHAIVTDAAHGFVHKDVFDAQLGKRKKWQRIIEETFKGQLHRNLYGAASGAGASAIASAAASGYLSVGRIITGTTSTGFARWYSWMNFWYDNAGDKLIQEFIGLVLGPVPDGTDDYRIRLCGLGLPSGSESGFSFTFDRAASTTTWQITKWVAGTPTHTNTSVALDTGRHRYRTEYNQATDSCEFFIDGVSVGTVSSLPTNIAGEYPYAAEIRKLAGTNSRELYGEWYACDVQYTTARPG